MHGGSLHRGIFLLQEFSLPTVQHQLDRSLENDTVVQALRAVRDAFEPRREADHPADRPVGIDQAGFAAGGDLIVRLDVAVVFDNSPTS